MEIVADLSKAMVDVVHYVSQCLPFYGKLLAPLASMKTVTLLVLAPASSFLYSWRVYCMVQITITLYY